MSRRSGRAKPSATGNNFQLISIVLLATLLLWLAIAVVFGGLGGHLFSQFSQLGFLQDSKYGYYATEEEMQAARKAYKARSKEAGKKWKAEKDDRHNTTSEYADKKSGILIYREGSGLKDAIERDSDSGRRRGGDQLRSNEDVQRDLDAAAAAEEEEETEEEEDKEKEREDSDEDIRSVKDAAGDDLENRLKSDDEDLDATETNEEGPDNSDAEVLDPNSKTVHAYDVSIIAKENSCQQYDIFQRTANIRFRRGSAAIKGYSLQGLDSLVDIHKDCPDTNMVVTQNPKGESDSKDNESLQLRRQDEIKYYLLHRRIPKESIAMREQL